MEEFAQLLTQYTLTDIILFVIALALSVKGIVTFYDWAVDRLKKKFGKEIKESNAKEEIINEIRNTQDTLNSVMEKQEEITQRIQDMAGIVDILIESDKDDIRAWITEKHHHFCYKTGHIDDYSLDCIEKRYRHYKDEGGNSYITTLVEEVRNLPKTSHIDSGDIEEVHNN